MARSPSTGGSNGTPRCCSLRRTAKEAMPLPNAAKGPKCTTTDATPCLLKLFDKLARIVLAMMYDAWPSFPSTAAIEPQ